MEEVKRLLDNFEGTIYDLCFEVLEKYGDSAEIFEFVCKNFLEQPEHGSISIQQYFSDNEIEEYKTVYGDTVDGLLNSNLKKCNLGLIAPEDFYKTLWAAFCANFSTRKEKAFAFYYTLIDTAIPYQYLGKPISMSNERFQEMLEKNKVALDKVKYILRSRYSQRTERASLLLNCLNEIEDFDAKTVVLAQAIQLFNRGHIQSPFEVDSLIQQIDKKIKELEAQEQEEQETT